MKRKNQYSIRRINAKRFQVVMPAIGIVGVKRTRAEAVTEGDRLAAYFERAERDRREWHRLIRDGRKVMNRIPTDSHSIVQRLIDYVASIGPA